MTMIILNVAFSFLQKNWSMRKLLQELKKVKLYSEEKFNCKIKSIRIGEEFCSKRLLNFNQEYIRLLLECVLISEFDNIEFVFPVIFEEDLSTALKILSILAKCPRINCIVLNNYGLIRELRKIGYRKQVGLGRFLPVFTITPKENRSLYDIGQIVTYKLRMMDEMSCDFGDINMVISEEVDSLSFSKLRFAYPYVYMTSTRECVYSLYDKTVRGYCCGEQCYRAMMISTSPDWKSKVIQIGNSCHFKIADINRSMLNRMTIIYTPIDYFEKYLAVE